MSTNSLSVRPKRQDAFKAFLCSYLDNPELYLDRLDSFAKKTCNLEPSIPRAFSENSETIHCRLALNAIRARKNIFEMVTDDFERGTEMWMMDLLRNEGQPDPEISINIAALDYDSTNLIVKISVGINLF